MGGAVQIWLSPKLVFWQRGHSQNMPRAKFLVIQNCYLDVRALHTIFAYFLKMLLCRLIRCRKFSRSTSASLERTAISIWGHVEDSAAAKVKFISNTQFGGEVTFETRRGPNSKLSKTKILEARSLLKRVAVQISKLPNLLTRQ